MRMLWVLITLSALAMLMSELGVETFGRIAARVKPGNDTFTCRITGGAADGDEIAAVAEGESSLYRITRKRGIGRAEVTLTRGDWPQGVRLEFAGFHNLESLVVYYGGLCLSTSLKNTPAVNIGRRRRNGDCPAEEKRQSRYEMQLTKTPEGISVELPGNLLSNRRRSFQIRWIDEYR